MVFRLQLQGGLGAPVQAWHELHHRLIGVLEERVLDDLCLLVSKVVTNAVRHGGTGGASRVEVCDSSSPTMS